MKVTITGVKEIARAYRDLPKKLANKVLKQAIREALRPMFAEAQSDAPYRTGTLARSIKLRAAAARKRGEVALEIRTGEGDFRGPTYYGAFVEYGTSKQPGQHYLARAFDAGADAAVARAERFIADGIEAELQAGNGKVSQ